MGRERNRSHSRLWSRLTGVVYMTLLLCGMAMGACYANPIMPPAYRWPITELAVFYAALLCVMLIPTGLFLLLWRLITRKRERKLGIKEHVLYMSYVLLGLLLCPFFVGYLILVFGLWKAGKAFIEDGASETEICPGLARTIGVLAGAAILIVLWQLWFVPKVDHYYAHHHFYAVAFEFSAYTLEYICRMIATWKHWFPSYDLFIYIGLTVLWGLVIPGALLLYKGKDILRKRIPDIITVFGLLLLGYWWWNFGGVLIYLLAFGLAVCILLDKPPYKQKKDDPAQ